VYRRGYFTQVKNIVLLRIDSSFRLDDENIIKPNLIILSQNANVDLPELIKKFKPEIMIIDGSNSLWKIAQWKSDCEELHLPCFSVAEDGAFILSLQD